ncbi:squamous cell carcinoma antigen recognized by T-cells 3 [Eupeodes corollae]|uniref:squamous cell carcinoma antigen recognized by T-cells 3 n=1 Tax=Eupeodes corollae TaxID=290404 RepID=UPI002493B632|nr:squamous cell carcinoma antigen recognized by T-cells 3 [Eupeodes corollae]
MSTNTKKYDEIDEAEEEALLKSDEEGAPPGNQALADDEDDVLMDEDTIGDTLPDGIENEEVEDQDDDDDDDSDLDDTTKYLIEYNNLLKEIAENQYAYDKYVKLCELSHKTDDLDNIRNAYNLFASVYPLSPELWLQFLRIEISVALSEEEIQKVDELFNKALHDYYSIEVALEFAVFASKTNRGTEIWDEILGTYGLHCLKGNHFFKLYRQYVEGLEKSMDEKTQLNIQSYLRQLKIPLLDMEDIYIEFKVAYEQNKATPAYSSLEWETIEKEYFRAKGHLQKILPHEQKLLEVDDKQYREKADIYRSYIKESDKFLDENILQTLYERLVADCCLNADCWFEYISFLDYRDEYERPKELQDLPVFRQNAVDVSNRALRNCSWNEKLYIKRMQLLEKMEKSRQEIQEVLESSLSVGFQTPEPAVAIWLEYLTYLRRLTDYEDEEECEILRRNFNLCWNTLGQQWGVLADCNCEILQFWGRLEYGPLRDPKKGKELWTTVMESADNATRSGLWIEFSQLEMRRDLDSTRKLFRKALNSQDLDNPYVIISAWQRFERCNGSIRSMVSCQKDCDEFLKNYQRTIKDITKKFEQKQQPKVDKKGKDRKRKASDVSQEYIQDKKAKIDTATEFDANTDISSFKERKSSMGTFKEHENQEIDLTKDHLRIFISNLDYNLNEDEVKEQLTELRISSINLIRSANGRSRGFGYVELEDETEVDKAIKLDRKLISGRPIYISSVLRDKEKRQKFKFSDGLEPKKLFVKGLPPDSKKEEVEVMFGSFGKLHDVRLVFHKSGKFKGIAYVEFEEEKSASTALMKMDQTELRDHIISVAISAPPPKPFAAGKEPPLSVKKILGMSTGRKPKITAAQLNQKPRMSLIPNAVRKQLTPSSLSTTTSSSTAANGSSKTNDDFRKLLLLKKSLS